MQQTSKQDDHREKGKKGLELIEESIHLLRQAPLAALTVYYAGTIPFVLGFLYFWAHMSRGYNAGKHLMPASIALAALFLVMKCCHSIFAGYLMARTMDTERVPLTGRRLLRLLALHGIYQPWGFLVLPVALLITIPFGWCFAFFQNLTVLALSGGKSSRETRKSALSQALHWPLQNNAALGTLLGFSFFVWINLAVAVIMLPHLVRILFGIETVFSRSAFHMANTTTLMIVTAGTFLCMDPIIKAFYTLRCFYGEARGSGIDLTMELADSRKRSPKKRGAATLVLLLSLTAAVPALSNPDQATPGNTGGGSVITSSELEESVTNVIERLEYTWRSPRTQDEAAEDSTGFWYELIDTVARWTNSVFEAIGRVLDWLAELIEKLLPEGDGPKRDWTAAGRTSTGHIILYILLLVGVVACVIVLETMVRRRRRDEDQETEAPAAASFDLEDESLLASDLPESEWITMARDLMARGENRLAIRALYLASLAHLAEGGLITLARHKTDREYERELAARGQLYQNAASSFSLITGIFERAWYGMHQTGDAAMAAFMEGHERIMSHAAQ
jgi:hypothetical protein